MQTLNDAQAMSALHPKAAVAELTSHFRFVPNSDIKLRSEIWGLGWHDTTFRPAQAQVSL